MIDVFPTIIKAKNSTTLLAQKHEFVFLQIRNRFRSALDETHATVSIEQ